MQLSRGLRFFSKKRRLLDRELLCLCKNPAATPEASEAILEAGANTEARNKEGLTPLILAALDNDNPKVIEVLLKAGASLLSILACLTALAYASSVC